MRMFRAMMCAAVSICAMVSDALADGKSWEDWLSERIGNVSEKHADEITGMLIELQNEHAVVLTKHDEFIDPKISVETDAGITQYARIVGEKMGCSVETLTVSYGDTKYTYETVGNISESFLRVKLHGDLRKSPKAAKARVIEIMAGQTINRNMIGQDKSKDWHRRLNDVQAVCLGFGTVLLSAVESARVEKNDSVDFVHRSPMVMDAVDIAWTMGAVARLRKQAAPSTKFSDVAADVAFDRGIMSLLANERRMKIMVKVSLIALGEGKPVVMPPTLPPWNTIDGRPVPAVIIRKKRMFDYWTPVPSESELAEGKTDNAKRLADMRMRFKQSVDKGRFNDATKLLSKLCLKDGPDFALAAVGALTNGDTKTAMGVGKRNIDKARWLSRLSEITEARNYLRANEDVLSGSQSQFYHHDEAAQRFVILGDEKRFLDEIAKTDSQSEMIVAVMRGTNNSIPYKEQASYGRKLEGGKPSEPAFTVAEHWWRMAKGKRKRVMDHYLSLSAEWYRKVVANSTCYRISSPPEWYRIAEKRSNWKPSNKELQVRLAAEPLAVGTTGVMMPVFEGSKASQLTVLASRTVTWRNRKKVVTRKETFYRPRDYWEHNAYAAGWMDENGNELRVFKVVNIPLRDDEFDESNESCPTKIHLEERLAASGTGFTGDKVSLALWASRFYGIGADESSLTKVPCGKLSKAYVFSTGDLSSGGIFLCTYRNEWLFVEMRLAGETADIDGLLRRLAIGTKTVSWKDTVGAPVGKEDGLLVYTTPGYVIKVDMNQSLASKFMSRIKPMLVGSRSAFMSYVPAKRDMKPSVLHVFNDRKKYDAYITTATERLENRTIGMWIGSREELVVMSGMKKINDEDGEETFRTLRHEAFHQYLFYATGKKGNATWYNEGHATFFETSIYSSGNNPLLPVDDKNLRYAKPYYKDAQKMADLMPTILKLPQAQFYDGPLGDVNDRYSAAWGLVYFLEKGIKVMDGMEKYESVLPTYFEEICKEGTSWEEATAKAWNGIDTTMLPSDFMKFWNNPKARKDARAYRPKAKSKWR